MPDDYEHEEFIPVWITLRCTYRAVAARVRYTPQDSPAEGAEFEVEEVRAGEDRELVYWSDLIEFVGLDEANRLKKKAEEKAVETGEY